MEDGLVMSPEKREFYISIAVSSSVFTLAGQRESRGGTCSVCATP